MDEADWPPASLPYPGPPPDGAADPQRGSGLAPGADPEWAAYLAWLDRELAAGHDPDDQWTLAAGEPAAEEAEPPAGAGAPAGTEPSAPAAPLRPGFGQGDAADVLAPSPLLAALTEEAAADLGRLSDDELTGVLQATRRQIAREQYKQVLATAEFGRRRRAAFEDAARRGVPVGCRPGGFPGEELAIELVTTRAEAGHRIDDALDLTARLPQTLAGLAAGRIDADRAGWIALYTRSLAPADAAAADQLLAAAAPELRPEQLARKAAALEAKLNPDAVAARREHAKRSEQRVAARREVSGNASLAGRELDTADVLAGKAHIDAIAARLRDSGLVDGPLDQLRALAFTDLMQGRNPLDRIAPAQSAGSAPAPAAAGPVEPAPATTAEPARAPGPAPAGSRPRPAPLPALINLTVPAGTVLGWSAAPAQASSWGLLGRDEACTVVRAAAEHPRTRWCVTLTAPDGTAVAHGCARGQHPGILDDLGPQPPPGQLAELLRRLGLVLTPVARGSCDHTQAEEHYSPSRALRHLVRTRSATCDAPGCSAPAVQADLDHTRAWPDGPTDQCNLAPRCRTHHRAKQAPDWTVEQTAPGVTRWTLPSGRTWTTRPTEYDS